MGHFGSKEVDFGHFQPISNIFCKTTLYFLIDVLIANGADINAADSDGNTALILASRTATSINNKETDECENVATRRKRRGVDTRRRPSQGRPSMVDKCIEKGSQVNHLNKWGRSAVHAAAFYGETEILGILVNKGADINAEDVNGYTPIIDASRGTFETSSGEVLKETDFPESDGTCDVAVRHRSRRRIGCQGHPQTVKACLAHGAHINALNKWKQSSLSFGMNTKRPTCGSSFRSSSGDETSLYSAF